ncbi:MAG TPA: S9 family peptidase [Thermoanaerobaculia bacterium]|jgi:dipeptidyl aminopeptidase/acylaminoacyl peptidase
MLGLLLAATLTVTDYATMPQLASPRFSPDGKRVAYVVTKADLTRSAYNSDVWIVPSDGGTAVQLTRANGSDHMPRWSPDGSELAFLSDRGGSTQVWLISTQFGEARQLTDEPTSVREHAWSPDGKSIAFTRADEVTAEEKKRVAEKDDPRVIGEGTKHMHLYTVDVETKAVRRLTRGDFTVFTMAWSPDGKTIAFDRGTGSGLDHYYRTDIWTVDRDGALKPLVVRTGMDRAPVWSPDGRSIAFLSTGGAADWLIEHRGYAVPANGGTPRELPVRNAERLHWTDALYYDGPVGSTNQIYRDGKPLTNIDGVAEELDVWKNRLAYVRQSVNEPPELYVDGKRITDHNAGYRNREIGETRVIRWKNPKDGLEIEGLLTLPVGYQAGTRVPLLTFVHGGPASRFTRAYLGYLGHVYAPQALAADGFAILRPNPRGTGGYSEAFMRANIGDWGGMDWLDVNAGIDQVIADGIADPRRLGLMGWSYGGYLAAWAIGHSDRFRAISIGAPVVDLMSMHGTADIRDFIPSYFAKPFELDRLRERSPLWTLKKTSAKVLIQHGENDERVPLSQGTMLYRALDELGVDVQMVVYPRTPHSAREPKLRMDVANRNREFFAFLQTKKE